MKKIILLLCFFGFLTTPAEIIAKKEKTEKVNKAKKKKASKKGVEKKNTKKKKNCKSCKPKKNPQHVIKGEVKKSIDKKENEDENEITKKNAKEKSNEKQLCACDNKNEKQEKIKADLSFLNSNVQDAQRIYFIWKDLIEEPLPDFNLLRQFIILHPNWPSIHIIKEKLEKQLNYQLTEDEILKWFVDNPPVTINGVRMYAKTLIQRGQTDRASYFIKKTWRDSEASDDDLNAFQKEFYEYIEAQDHQARIDRLLSKEKIDSARKVLGWLNKRLEWYPKPQRDLALMRITLLDNKLEKEKIEEKLQETKEIFKNDPGLIYEEIKWRRKNKENDLVIALLNSDFVKGLEKANPTLFWGERNIMARRMLEDGAFQKSLDLLKNHQLSTGEHYVVAEWLAAFIEMTYLDQVEASYGRLKKLYNKVRMPISLSRIAYWIAVACEKMKADEEAIRWYKKAATHVGTYYGQLAICWLEDHRQKPPKVPVFVEDVFSLTVKQRFDKRELVKAVRAIAALGEPKETVDLFFQKIAKDIVEGEEYRLLTSLAAEIAPAKTAVSLSRVALDKMIITNGTYPILEETFLEQTVDKFSNENPIYPHIVHALIRRESAFDPNAMSYAGAKGLMQVIDKTAAITIQKLSFLCETDCKDPRKYIEPLYNVAIGTLYFKELLEKYKGSIVLALCGYNAGPEAVDNLFCTCIGNPLEQKTNMIQWIELIPYGETRNYVMRVLESFMMYVERAKQKNPSIKQYRMIDLINLGTLRS